MTDKMPSSRARIRGSASLLRSNSHQAGHVVWLGCRDLKLGEQATEKLSRDGLAATAIRLDVTDDGSVDEAVGRLEAEAPALHVLVNNAGLMFGRALRPSEEPVD